MPEDETSELSTKHPRLSSDTEETDAYSEPESHDDGSHESLTKKDSNENHIVQNDKDAIPNGVNNSGNKDQHKNLNGFYHDNDLPVDLSNHKSKHYSHDNKVVPEKKESNGFIGQHFLQKAYTVNRNSPNDFSFRPKKKLKQTENTLKNKALFPPTNGFVNSEYDFNE